MSTQVSSSEKKLSLRQRVGEWTASHGVLTAASIAVLVAAVLGLTFWFTVFSGLSSSADFVYSQF